MHANEVNVRKLLWDYGRIDHILWDGGGLAEQGTDADAAYCHESGDFIASDNLWPISPEYIEKDGEQRRLSKRDLGRLDSDWTS